MSCKESTGNGVIVVKRNGCNDSSFNPERCSFTLLYLAMVMY